MEKSHADVLWAAHDLLLILNLPLSLRQLGQQQLVPPVRPSICNCSDLSLALVPLLGGVPGLQGCPETHRKRLTIEGNLICFH